MKRHVGQVDDEVPRVVVQRGVEAAVELGDVGKRDLAGDGDDLRRHRHAPVRATRGGALHVRCPSAARTGRPGTGPIRPGPRAPRPAAPAARSPGPSSSTLRWMTSPSSRSCTSTEPCATPVWRTALATSSVASSRRSWAVRGAELVGDRRERGGDVAGRVHRRREALGHDPRRRHLQREARDVVARRARGDLDRGALEVLDHRGRAVGRALGDQRHQLGLGQQPPRRGGLADAVGVEREQVAGAELGGDLGQLGPLDDPERRADLARAASRLPARGQDRRRMAGGRHLDARAVRRSARAARARR